MEQGGLTLPSHTYYLKADGASKAKVRALHTMVSNVFALLGHEEAECKSAADGVVLVETEIAKMFLSHEQERDANSLPPLSFQQVAAGMSGQGPFSFDWMLFFRRLGVRHELLQSPHQKVVRVLDVSFYQKLCGLLAAKPPTFWRYYLKWYMRRP